MFNLDARAECNAEASTGDVFNLGISNADNLIIPHGNILQADHQLTEVSSYFCCCYCGKCISIIIAYIIRINFLVNLKFAKFSWRRLKPAFYK
jgi:hypothetical protein